MRSRAVPPPARVGAAVSLGVFAALLLLAWAIFGQVRLLPPFGGDNLHPLAWAARQSAATILAGDPAFYPEWRPLAYGTIWLQYQWAGLAHVPSYYEVNLLLWVGAAWMVWRLAVRLGVAPGLALVAGALVLTDARGVFTVAWIADRQMSLACAFGLGALLLAAWDPRPRGNRRGGLALALLLLAAALSKEFGLAFAVAVAAGAWWERRLDRIVAASAAVAVYAALRLAITYGAPMLVCEEMGYFGQLRHVCFSPLTGTALAQMAYNVVAAGVDGVLPGLLSANGRIDIAPGRVGFSLVWLALAVVGWRRGPATSRLAWTLIVATAALNFMLYRDRNHLPALCAMSVAVATGLQSLTSAALFRSRLARASAILTITGLLIVQAVQTHRVVASMVAQERDADPCTELGNMPNLDRAFVRRVKLQYRLPNPDCEPPPDGAR